MLARYGRSNESNMKENIQHQPAPPVRRGPSPKKIASYVGIVIGAIVLVCVLVILFFSGPLVNKFVKPGIAKAFAEAYPEYSIRIADVNYSFFTNRVGIDSVALSAADGSFSGSVGPFSVSGVGWRHLLWGGNIGPKELANIEFDAQDIMLDFPMSQYRLRCGRLHVSVPDSLMVADALELNPIAGDEQFFRASKFRSTRFRLLAPHCSVTGLAFLELLEEKNYRARSAQINDLLLDVLLNKDKPYDKKGPSPLMPNEMLSSMEGILQVDSVSIVNARVKYGERMELGAKPALITFDDVQMFAKGIANHGDRHAVLLLQAQGIFMKAGTMKVLMSIPVASKGLTYRYSGSLSKMDLRPINGFLETAEQRRIKSGVLEAATFDINVASGRASGHVRAVYRDLGFVLINKETGSEGGFFNSIASYIGKAFKIRGTNVPDQSGSMKIGAVNYTRKRDEAFLEFSWFSLRGGVGDTVGF